jgi:hypothetical protein
VSYLRDGKRVRIPLEWNGFSLSDGRGAFEDSGSCWVGEASSEVSCSSTSLSIFFSDSEGSGLILLLKKEPTENALLYYLKYSAKRG